MRNLYKSITGALLVCAAGLALTGCGGGGGEDHQPTVRFAAEGFWGGPDVDSMLVGGRDPAWNGDRDYFWGTPSTLGDHAGLVVLPDGDTWGVYTASGVVIGGLHGQTRTGRTGVEMDARFFDIGYPADAVKYSGGVTPRSRLDIEGDRNNGTHFVTSYDDHYDHPASLSQLSGNYTGTGGTTRGNNPGARYSISIGSDGAVTLPPDAVRCSASGKASPRTDKNVFNLSLRFSGTQCALGNGAQINGIAVSENGHLMLIGATLDNQDMFVYVSN